MHLSKFVIWGSSLDRGFRLHRSRRGAGEEEGGGAGEASREEEAGLLRGAREEEGPRTLSSDSPLAPAGDCARLELVRRKQASSKKSETNKSTKQTKVRGLPRESPLPKGATPRAPKPGSTPLDVPFWSGSNGMVPGICALRVRPRYARSLHKLSGF